jgi:hypothetical protein
MVHCGDRRFRGVFLMDRAILLHDHQRRHDAKALFDEAWLLVESTGERTCMTLVQSHLGALAADAGESVAAERHFADADVVVAGLEHSICARVLEIQRCHLEPGHALAVIEREDPRDRSDHVVLAKRILRRSLARHFAIGGFLVVDVGRQTISTPEQRVIDLSRRGAQWRIACALARARKHQPGAGSDVDTRDAAPGGRVAAASSSRCRR